MKTLILKLSTMLVLVTLMISVASAATTNTYYVSKAGTSVTPYATLGTAATDIQAAITQAQADLVPGTTDCTVLVADGIYTVTAPVTITKGITLRSINGYAGAIIDGGYPTSTNRCMTITNCNAVVSGFTVQNGFAYGGDGVSRGGGIYAIDATGIIEDCLIRKNRSQHTAPNTTGVGSMVGGMFVEGGALIIRGCVIEGNSTLIPGDVSHFQSGTGIYINNSPGVFMYDCIVSNHVQTGNNGSGAGLLMTNSKDGIVSNCQFIANTCSRWGANYVFGGTVTHSLISNNTSRSSAGGLLLQGDATGSKLLHSRIVNNSVTAGNGGGVYINRGILENCIILNNISSLTGGGVSSDEGTIKNCLIAGNEAGTTGGGLHRANKKHIVRNCTIVQNKAATEGGGVYNLSTTANNFLNCIITDNSASLTNDCYSIQDGVIGYSCSPDLVDGVNGNITAAPIFVKDGTGTGLTAVLGDYRLRFGSPGLDVGAYEAWMASAVDLQGAARKQGSAPEMGAYEGAVMPRGTSIIVR